jgi:hypothetical protein
VNKKLVMKYSNRITLVFSLLALFNLSLFAQHTETRSLNSFTEIEVAQGIELVAKKGTENKVTIEARGIDTEDVYTDFRGSTLKLRLRQQLFKSPTVRVELTYTEELEGVKVSSSAQALFRDVIKTRRLELGVSTSGILEAEIEVELLDLSATTSGEIELSGKAKEIEVSATTGGDIDAMNVETDDVYAKANTGAIIRVTANERLKGSANTGGDVRYRGNPKTDIRTSTGGSIRKN